MKSDVYEYFIQKYKESSFRVVPGHWPNFKSKEEVDEWISKFESINAKMFDELFAEED